MMHKKHRRYYMLKRYGQIIEVLQKYGFGYIVDQIGLTSFRDMTFSFIKRQKIEHINTPKPARIRMMLEELGPTYVKLGQLLSMRHDIIPPTYAREFAKLQDEVPPFDFEEVEEIIRAELGHPIEELFDYFDKKPLACASIGQVHRAKIKDGDNVVVKVQRPGIKQVIESDLDIMHSLARLVSEHMPEARLYRPIEIVDELSRSILEEIDYTHEGWNTDRFAYNFRNNGQVHIPKIYWTYTSKRVLTLEFIQGVKASRVDLLEKRGFDKSKIAIVVGEAFTQQIFADGFFHADLHPGNVLIMEDGRVAFLDFGMTGHLSSEMRDMFLDGLTALVNGDSSLLVEISRDMGSIDHYVDIRSLKADIDYFRSKYYGRAPKNIEASAAIEELIGILRKHQVTIPHNIALLVRGIVAVEGFTLLVDPDFNLTGLLENCATKEIKARYHPQNLADKTYGSVLNWSRLFQKVPNKISHILDNAENGCLNIKFESEEGTRLISEINIASNRLSFSLIVSAMIVASSLIVQIKTYPMVPVIGTLGFLAASVFGVWLVFNMFRTGRV
ncbi:MAG: ubiquinone biosynthesis protein [Euryarchaeota archaeon]|nr:ubiquinone biosynthesis protein [Euryarchaeota archaeon]